MFTALLRFRSIALVAGISWLALSAPAWSLDGTQPLQLSPLSGWNAFEIVTQLDVISGVADPIYGTVATRGKYDGIGAYRRSAHELTLTLNHETTPAAVSGLTLDLPSFREAIQSTLDGGITAFPGSFVQRIGFAYDAIFDGSYDAITNPDPVASGTAAVSAYGAANFARFCSGTTHRANQFGLNRGLVDPIYITGEEVAGGKFYALDVTTNTFWESPDLGLGNWENAAQLDTGNTTHAALLLSSDVGDSPGDYLQMYVGEKNVDANADGQIDFLERNGLRGGTVYYFAPDAGFSLTDLPDGTVTGQWQTSTVGALRETKLEDVHTNPHDGSQLALAAQRDGVYILNSALVVTSNGLDTAATNVTVSQIDDDDTPPVGAPDNLVWSGNGKLYVQEDGDGNGMFEMSSAGGDLTQIATAFSEPSGIVDISSLVGFADGSVLLSSIQGSDTAVAQLSVLLAPDATRILLGDFNGDEDYTCTDVDALVAEIVAETHGAMFDVTGDGLVDRTDLAAWLAEAGAAELASGNSYLVGDATLDGVVDGADFVAWNSHKFTQTSAWCSGDFNADGVVDGIDFILWNDNKFTAADRVLATLPEPAAYWLGLASLLMLTWGCRRQGCRTDRGESH